MKSDEKQIVITSAVRTAVGSFNGKLKNLQGHELGSVVVKEVMKRSNLKSIDVDEVHVIGKAKDVKQLAVSNPQLDKDNESNLEIEISFDELVDMRFNLLK